MNRRFGTDYPSFMEAGAPNSWSYAQRRKAIKDNDEYGPRDGQPNMVDYLRIPNYTMSCLFYNPSGAPLPGIRDSFQPGSTGMGKISTITEVQIKRLYIEGSNTLSGPNSDVVALGLRMAPEVDEGRHSVNLGTGQVGLANYTLGSKYLLPLTKTPTTGAPGTVTAIFEPKQPYYIQIFQRPSKMERIQVWVTTLNDTNIDCAVAFLDLEFTLQKW